MTKENLALTAASLLLGVFLIGSILTAGMTHAQRCAKKHTLTKDIDQCLNDLSKKR